MSNTLIVSTGERKTLVIVARAVVYREEQAGTGSPRKVSRMAEAGVLDYTMPSEPTLGVVQAYLNGELLDTEVAGDVVTLQGYAADFIEATDELLFFYTEA